MKIIHIDMDMFFAAVEIRDNPELKEKPLVIGALPTERGVVSTCNYIARKFGVRSGMSIKDAYRLCPQGVYMHGNGHKYVEASRIIRKIWGDYTDLIECISLDEGFLDVTGSEQLFGGALNIAKEIKRRVFESTQLTCSAGIGYSKMSAKLASEEKKPDGLFEILTAEDLRNLIVDRSIRIIYGIGIKTEEKLNKFEIRTVRDIYNNNDLIRRVLGNHGQHLIDLANGIDSRRVLAPAANLSLGKETTFQEDITDRDYLRDVLRLLARKLSFKIRLDELYASTITLKITFCDMKKITRSKTANATNRGADIYKVAAELLDKVERRPIRLIGISLSGFTNTPNIQMTLFDNAAQIKKVNKIDKITTNLQKQYGLEAIKSASELKSQNRFKEPK